MNSYPIKDYFTRQQQRQKRTTTTNDTIHTNTMKHPSKSMATLHRLREQYKKELAALEEEAGGPKSTTSVIDGKKEEPTKKNVVDDDKDDNNCDGNTTTSKRQKKSQRSLAPSSSTTGTRATPWRYLSDGRRHFDDDDDVIGSPSDHDEDENDVDENNDDVDNTDAVAATTDDGTVRRPSPSLPTNSSPSSSSYHASPNDVRSLLPFQPRTTYQHLSTTKVQPPTPSSSSGMLPLLSEPASMLRSRTDSTTSTQDTIKAGNYHNKNDDHVHNDPTTGKKRPRDEQDNNGNYKCGVAGATATTSTTLYDPLSPDEVDEQSLADMLSDCCPSTLLDEDFHPLDDDDGVHHDDFDDHHHNEETNHGTMIKSRKDCVSLVRAVSDNNGDVSSSLFELPPSFLIPPRGDPTMPMSRVSGGGCSDSIINPWNTMTISNDGNHPFQLGTSITKNSSKLDYDGTMSPTTKRSRRTMN